MRFIITDPYVFGCVGMMTFWTSWLICRYRRGAFFTFLVVVPLMMLGLLFAMSDFSTSMIAFSTVGAFLVFAITDVTLGSRRVHITRKMLMAVADSSIYTIAVCITVPSVLAVLRGAGTDVVMMAFLLGGAASCLIQQMRRLASKLRGRSEIKSRFQLRLVTLLTTTLLVGFVLIAQQETGLFCGFAGAGIYWGGLSQLPTPRRYQWHGNSDSARRQIIGTAAVLLGVAVIIFGISIVAIQ